MELLRREGATTQCMANNQVDKVELQADDGSEVEGPQGSDDGNLQEQQPSHKNDKAVL